MEPELAAKRRKGRKSESRRIEERPPRTEGGIALPPEERFFTKPELAKVMKVSVRCITDMMRRGEIRYLKFNGHMVRFRLQDVNQRLSETVLFCEMPPKVGLPNVLPHGQGATDLPESGGRVGGGAGEVAAPRAIALPGEGTAGKLPAAR